MPLHTALAKSKNMVSIRLLQAIGPRYVQGTLPRFGFEPAKHPAYLPMALGAGSVTPLQMAAAYSVFANGGYRINPALIARLTDSKGRGADRAPSPPHASTSRCGRSTLATRSLMDSLLQEVARVGTAAKAQGDAQAPRPLRQDRHDERFDGRLVRRLQPDAGGNPRLDRLRPAEEARRRAPARPAAASALPVWIELRCSTRSRRCRCRSRRRRRAWSTSAAKWVFDEYVQGRGVQQPLASRTTCRSRRAPRSATASSTCSGADRRRRRSEGDRPAGVGAGVARERREELASVAGDPTAGVVTEVEAAAFRREPHLVQRRLRVDHDLACVGEDELRAGRRCAACRCRRRRPAAGGRRRPRCGPAAQAVRRGGTRRRSGLRARHRIGGMREGSRSRCSRARRRPCCCRCCWRRSSAAGRRGR